VEFFQEDLYFLGEVVGSSNLDKVKEKFLGHFLTLFYRAILGQNLGCRAIFFLRSSGHPTDLHRIF